MNEEDGKLGMDRNISRRQLLDGAGRSIGAAMLTGVASSLGAAALSPAAAAPGQAAAPAGAAPASGAAYPPMLRGIRGQTDADYAVPHALRDGQTFPDGEDAKEVYDLVVVGAGMSGLSAAYFYRKALPHAKVLVLDNCDDFGGHARRNEFVVNGRKLIAVGGTNMIMFPGTYTPEGKALLAEIGVDAEAAGKAAASDWDRLSKFNLGIHAFFDKESFGRDKLVGNYPLFQPFGHDNTPMGSWKDFLAQTPLSARSRKELLRITNGGEDYMPGLSAEEKIKKLRAISYTDYLKKYFGAGDETLRFIQNQAGGLVMTVGGGPDSFSAWLAYSSSLPGFKKMGLPPVRLASAVTDEELGQDIQLPGGNAEIARLLVRWLIPGAHPGKTIEDSVSSPVNYGALDNPANDVRLRLASTVTHVRHLGDPADSDAVEISYVRGGKSYRVRAAGCVMACFNAIVPYLCPELPAPQKEALKLAVRKPLVWTSVALNNWRAFDKLKTMLIYSPGSFYHNVFLDIGRTLGNDQGAKSPDDPAVVYLAIAPNSPGMPARDQYRANRAELLGIDLATYEREAKSLLQRILGPGGFDPERDIAGITVNRWAHGYACGPNDLYDPPSRTGAPMVQARQRFGRITIANSDSAGIAMTQAAFDQADRAVRELLTDVVRPQFYVRNPERG